MAGKVLEIIHIPDKEPTDVDDDEISVLNVRKKGATKSDAISVDDYCFKPKRRLLIDLSRNPEFHRVDDDDDDVEILPLFPKPRRRVLRGEGSRSKPENNDGPLGFLCEICADEKPHREKFSISGCDHSYCSDCMRKYVASKLLDNVISISCPVSGCKGSLEPQQCRPILSDQVFDRWGDALCEAVISASEKFYCPFKDCSALLVKDSGGIMEECECPICRRLFCVQCEVPWHNGLSCDEFKKLRADERSSEDIMLVSLAKRMKWMRCPKCRFYVEKSDGCLFMRCRCGHGFCYKCGAPLKDHYCPRCNR